MDCTGNEKTEFWDPNTKPWELIAISLQFLESGQHPKCSKGTLQLLQVTFWSAKWRSLNPWTGHLKHPKRSLGRTWLGEAVWAPNTHSKNLQNHLRKGLDHSTISESIGPHYPIFKSSTIRKQIKPEITKHFMYLKWRNPHGHISTVWMDTAYGYGSFPNPHNSRK